MEKVVLILARASPKATCDNWTLLFWLAVTVNLTLSRVPWEGVSVEKLLRSDGPMRTSVRVVLIAHWCRRAQPTVGGTIPLAVDVSCIRKLAKWKPLCEPANSIPSWFLLKLLPWLSSTIAYHLSCPGLPLVRAFCHRNRNKNSWLTGTRVEACKRHRIHFSLPEDCGAVNVTAPTTTEEMVKLGTRWQASPSPKNSGFQVFHKEGDFF